MAPRALPVPVRLSVPGFAERAVSEGPAFGPGTAPAPIAAGRVSKALPTANTAQSQQPGLPGAGTRPPVFLSPGDAVARAALGAPATQAQSVRFLETDPVTVPFQAPEEPADRKLQSADLSASGPVDPAAAAAAECPVGPPPTAENPGPATPDSPPSGDPPASLKSGLQNLLDPAPAGPPLPEIAFGARLVARSLPDGETGPVVPVSGGATPAAAGTLAAASLPAAVPFVLEAGTEPAVARQEAGRADAGMAAPVSQRSSNGATLAPADSTPNSSPGDEHAWQSGEDGRSAPQKDPGVLSAVLSPAAEGHPAQGPDPALSVAPTAQISGMRSDATSSAGRSAAPGSAPAQSAPGLAAPDTPGTGAARDIALRISADDQSAVEVRLSERAGEVRVAVRSADPEMAESMRAQLPELMDRLGTRGFETEVWRPQQTSASERGGSGSNPQSGSREGGRDPQQERGGRDGRQSREQPQPEWMEELATPFRPPKPSHRSKIL